MRSNSLGHRIAAGVLSPSTTRDRVGPPSTSGYGVPRRVLAGVLGVDLPPRHITSGGSGPTGDNSTEIVRETVPGATAASSAAEPVSDRFDAEASGETGASAAPVGEPDSSAVTIRSVRGSELPALHRVDRLVFGRFAYPYFMLRQLVELHADHCLVADDRGELVGYCLGAPSDEGQIGWILGLTVLPRVRGAGYARDLIREVSLRLFADDVREIRLAMYPDNDRAIRLYTSLGFTHAELRPDYFGPGADRLIMAVRAGEMREGEWAGADAVGAWLASDAHDVGIGLGRMHFHE